MLRMRFGLDSGADATLEEIGQRFNVTRERIRQIEAKALRKLRMSMAADDGHPLSLYDDPEALHRSALAARSSNISSKSS